MRRQVKVVQTYNQTLELLTALERQGARSNLYGDRHCDRELMQRYDTLWKDARDLFDDADLEHLVKPLLRLSMLADRLDLPRGIYVAVAVLLASGAAVAILYLKEIAASPWGTGVLLAVVLSLGFALVVELRPTTTRREVYERARVLKQFVLDHMGYEYPYLAEQTRPSKDRSQEFERKVEALELENEMQAQKLQEAQERIHGLQERLAGLETPSHFEVDDKVLAKLEPLEKIRLLEAIQAYRVNAWTATAAVCGMILEGRLQRLCRANHIPTGSINAMIQRLGEAGLLRGYFEQLARVGEFFRHRAAHPTSEIFDREKTTLILTCLVLLVREVFDDRRLD
jgi:hypothetical protein